jgi:hypothetical protein
MHEAALLVTELDLFRWRHHVESTSKTPKEKG